MAEQLQDISGGSLQGEKSLISDTITELFQSSEQVDIARTLGLLDDDSASLTTVALDTSEMVDPSSFLNPSSAVVSNQIANVSEESTAVSSCSDSQSLSTAALLATPTSDTPTTGAADLTSLMTVFGLRQMQPATTSILGSTTSPVPIPSATHILQTDSPVQNQPMAVQDVGVVSQSLSNTNLSTSLKATEVPTSTNLVKPDVPVTSAPLASSESPLTSAGAATTKPMAGGAPSNQLSSVGASAVSTAASIESQVHAPPIVAPLTSMAHPQAASVAPSAMSTKPSPLPSSSSLSSVQTLSSNVSAGVQVTSQQPRTQASLGASSRVLQKAVVSNLFPNTPTPLMAARLTPTQATSTAATPKAGVSVTTAEVSMATTTAATPIQTASENTSMAASTGVTTPITTPTLPSQTVASQTNTAANAVTRTSTTPTVENTSTPPAATPTTSQANTTSPKGLNLPLLQFLQANFPALQLGDTSGDMLQVHALLAHVLQQQQQLQQLQQQAQQQVQKAVASGQTAATTPLPPASSTTGKPTLHVTASRSAISTSNPTSAAPTTSSVSKPVKPVMQVSKSTATSSSPAATSSTALSQALRQRPSMPVFAQVLPQVTSGGTTKVTISHGVVGRPSPVVIPKQPKNGSFTSPLLLSRQKTKVKTALTSVPQASSSASVSLSLTPSLSTSLSSTSSKKGGTPLIVFKREGGGTRMSTRAAAKQQHLTKTLVEPVDTEPMDLDVGEPFQILELPPHLRDHSYSRYNPEEGDKVTKQRTQNIRTYSSIPPARVSYAPPLPDSPDTLYKLLKVLPKKSSSRRSSTASTRTPRRTKSGRFTPSGGGRSRRAAAASGGGRGMVVAKGRGGSSKPSSRAESEEPASASSESESSDNEQEMSKVERRRSQRTAGQRKRYVDDLNISFSDEEMQEGIMNPTSRPLKEYKGYGDRDENDSEYDHTREGTPGGSGAANGNRQVKPKVSLNPTEGFHHSDVYFEPPPEEANVVERILSLRTRAPLTNEEREKYGSSVTEYYVKYKSYSYLHAEWGTFEKLLAGDKRFDGKAKRFKAKQATALASVDDELFNPEYTMAERVLDVATQTEPNGDIVTHYLVKWRSLPYEEGTWELEEDTDPEAVRKFNKLQMIPPDDELQFKPRPPPALFKPLKECKEYGDGNKLRPYQLEGVNWLLFNWYTRQNCILADEMGLGKTVQSIVLLNEIFQRTDICGPFLVIAPLSTIANWQREFESWSDFNVVIYHGSVYSRRLINEYELYYRDSSGKIVPDAFKFNVIVTTYEVMLADDSELQNIQWRVVIIDEAHRLKNRNCKLLEGLKSLDLEHRVLLTGTPLQNSVEELFSLLNFLEPSTFPSHLAFLQQFGDLKSEEQVEELKGILKPMMLRRLKEDVEKSLAPKEETIVEVELTVIQKQYYRAILERNFTFLSKGGPSAVPSLLNVMMELRKCCNHPFLIKGAEQQIVEDFLRRNKENTASSNVLVQASGKLVLIDKLLPKLKANGHKVLIFSQMVRVLDILEDYLRMKAYLYERIDGNVRGILRQEAIDRFSKQNSDRFVFLLCTRAGGLGINLTAADTVIIYDSDWNPQNDLQAQARCHRIGQNKAVKVYRLITRNTYEREMFNRASLKLGLDKAVLQSMHGQQSATSNGSQPPQLSKKEIEDLLKKGAYGAVMEEDDDANKFCEEDIDQILERRTHVIQLESEAKGSTFAKASFVAEGSSDINVNDPDFWQKWAEKAKLDLDELANKDSLVLDTPRLRRKVNRYGNDNVEEIVDMSDAIDAALDILPSKGKHGWTKLECLKVEKGLLVYGWGDWKSILRNGKFKKRQLGIKDIENIARTMLVYCLYHFTGDDKVTPYIKRLINPSIVTEERNDDDQVLSSLYHDYDEEDYLNLLKKDSETLFQDSSYMKHLRRHANKILLRVRQLHILRWNMLSSHYSKIMKGVPAKSLGLDLPKPEEPPPASWWNLECDHSLLVGIVKYGYEQFGKMRSDPALCFKALCGEEPPRLRKKGKAKAAAGKQGATEKVGGASLKDEDSEGSESGEEEESDGEMESGPSTPATPGGKRMTRSTVNLKPGQYPWPSLAEVNTRARRYISAWIKQLRREELKQAHLLKDKERKERDAEASRKKEQKKAELAQKWSKREEQDFARVISFFGVEFKLQANKYDWTTFRQLASLTKKSDERLTLYLHDFKQMCWRVLKKKKIKKGLSGIKVEAVNEEKAAKCLQRINLLSAVREEILRHPDFDDLIQLCELSFEVPQWWIPVQHDTDLLRGVAKYGLSRSDQLIYNDTDLCFKETVPASALFDPTTNQVLQLESDSEEEEEEGEIVEQEGRGEHEGGKAKSSGGGSTSSSNPVPLGWPKEKAITIRITRIVYAFRNKVWPKPMEGLDLFTPSVQQRESSSESSESEGDGNSDSDYLGTPVKVGGEPWKKRPQRGQGQRAAAKDGEDPLHIDVEDERDFEIEKSQGLKLTLKKATKAKKALEDSDRPSKLEVRIPLVQLSFPSVAGMKRIPKKRPAPSDTAGDSPEAKRAKTSSNSSTPTSVSNKNVVIIDPTKVNFTELSGVERVGVINRNTQEKLPLKQSPMLKNLRLWLEGHPHYNVEHTWGPLVIEWGALKPEMYNRILQTGQTLS